MCGIVGYVGDKQAQDVVIEGLRRLEYRGYDSAGVALVDRRRASRGASAPASSPTSRRRWPTSRSPPSTTGIGHTRWATHGAPNDVNAHPHLGANGRVARRPQRDHRELRDAARRARGAGRRAAAPRPTPRSPPTCSERSSVAGGDLTDAMRTRLPAARGRVHPGRGRRRGPDPGRRGPPQLAAGGRPRRGRELPRLRRGRVHRAHPRGAGARPGPDRHDHPRRRRGHRLRRRARRGHAATTSTGTSPPRRRTATTGSCARRSSSSRGRSPTRCSGRHDADGRLQLDEMRISDDELREVDKIIIIACGTAFYAGLVAKYAIEHWTRIPCEVELAREFRYRDPILDPRHARGRDQPVRRDRRHPDGDPPRPRAAARRCWRSATPTARRSRASPTR